MRLRCANIHFARLLKCESTGRVINMLAVAAAQENSPLYEECILLPLQKVSGRPGSIDIGPLSGANTLIAE